MNPLDNLPYVRKALYFVQWVANGVIGVLGIVFTAKGDSPAWFILTVACLAFLWTYAGITAQTNVATPDDPGPGV